MADVYMHCVRTVVSSPLPLDECEMIMRTDAASGGLDPELVDKFFAASGAVLQNPNERRLLGSSPEAIAL